MSRCFPFPPPGYEKKARTDEVDLLIKDKHKEKKHKKDKKDKKKEGKDKDKDRSKDKDREKKERREKHKDKKSKDKRRTDENKIEGTGECSNGVKSHLDYNQQPEAIKNTKFVEISPRVVADEERRGRNQMAENLPAATDQREEEGGVGRLVDKYFDNWVQDKEIIKGKEEPKKKIEMQRVNAEGRIIGKSVVSSLSGAEQRRVAATVRPIEKDAERKMEAKENKKEQVVTEAPRKMEGEEKKKEQVGSDVARKMEGKEKKKDPEGKEKKKDKESKKEEKRKHRDGEKKSKEKKGSEKEKSKEKVKHENKKQDDKTIEDVPKMDHRINTTLNIKPIQIPTLKDSNTGSREDHLNLKKRKESDTNGFLHDNVVPPNKLLKPTISSSSSPLPLTMNGRKQELCQPQPASPFAVAVQRGPNSVRFDNKVLKANGLIQSPPPQPPTTSTSSSLLHHIKARENGESSKKPHPDTKYLSQILSVPKMDDWSDFDDQEWLFSNEGKKKPNNVSSEMDDIPQVWDRAMQIDSADLCALPYVIPY